MTLSSLPGPMMGDWPMPGVKKSNTLSTNKDNVFKSRVSQNTLQNVLS